MRRIGYTAADRDSALSAISGWVGRDIGSTNDLTAAEAGTALDAVQAEEDRRATREEAERGQAAAEAPQTNGGDPGPDEPPADE
jgi:hypothetical protein